jgi:ankyrin repeat protein
VGVQLACSVRTGHSARVTVTTRVLVCGKNMPPLHDACLARDMVALQSALRKGYKVDSETEAGVTPLMCAAMVSCCETLEELFSYGANAKCAPRARADLCGGMALRIGRTFA